MAATKPAEDSKNKTLEVVEVDMAVTQESEVDLYSEAGAYPQDDGTVLVKLNKSLSQKDGDPIDRVSIIRELTAAEQDKAGGVQVLGMMMNKSFSTVVSRVTSPMITPQVFLSMPSRDRVSIMQGILHFFA